MSNVIRFLAAMTILFGLPENGFSRPKELLSHGKLVDISSVKDKLQIFHDDHGHYLAVPSPFESSPSEYFFYGNGKHFFRQIVFGFSSDVDAKYFSLGFWEPRDSGENGARFWGDPDGYRVECANRITFFKLLNESQSRSLIKNAHFHDVIWSRKAYALARDNEGFYYYVDRPRNSQKSGFRIFYGRRGHLKMAVMKSRRLEQQEEIFVILNGELRLALTKGTGIWKYLKASKPLQLAPLEENTALIYSDLGAYQGQRLGTPCDDL